MPSAVTVTSRQLAMVSTDWAMARSAGSTPSPCTNDLSSFSVEIGKCFSQLSDEYPVPKSSMARETPM